LKPQIESALKGEPNESDTRLKVLDRFLFEVMEWKHEAVFTEPPTASGYKQIGHALAARDLV
jgi:hypothetical protein